MKTCPECYGKKDYHERPCQKCLNHGVVCECGSPYVVTGNFTKWYACEKCLKAKQEVEE